MYAADNFVAGAGLMGLDRKYLLKEEHKQAARADRVVVVTEHLSKHWQALGHEPILIPNGCDTERFANVDMAPWPDDVNLPGPIAGVFGHISQRIDLSLLEAVADRGLSLLLVGSVQSSFDLSQLLRRKNVRYVGRKPFELMPSYLRVIDVGLTPYSETEFNQASFPLKTLEYLAAGRGAVSTDLSAARWLSTDLIATARDPRSFADAVERTLAQSRTPQLLHRRQTFARKHSWIARAEHFASVLGLDSAVQNEATPQALGSITAPTLQQSIFGSSPSA
ncbi:glycosyltransferase [Microvirga ossetica]|uniref:glycosyltransferase n=1 Tax=Microvirga ossetica TaxID=1882682 RepID=UPI00130003E9|nr:glycosyltransferase [Microvirga ossetica]